MPSQATKKRYRPVQACDSCHKKKTSTHSRDSILMEVTGHQYSAAKLYRMLLEIASLRGLPSTQDSLYLQAKPGNSVNVWSVAVSVLNVNTPSRLPMDKITLLANTLLTFFSLDEDAHEEQGTRDAGPIQMSSDLSASNTVQKLSQWINGHQTIDRYFNEVIPKFPIISGASFTAWLGDGNDNDPAFRTASARFSVLHSSTPISPIASPPLSS